MDMQRGKALQRFGRDLKAAEPIKGEKTPYEIEWVGRIRGLKLLLGRYKATGTPVEQRGGRVWFPIGASVLHKHTGEEGLGVKLRTVFRMEDKKMRKTPRIPRPAARGRPQRGLGTVVPPGGLLVVNYNRVPRFLTASTLPYCPAQATQTRLSEA